MAYTPFERLLQPDYFDEFHLPRGGLNSSVSSLPSARAVSLAVHQGQKGQGGHEPVSLMVMQFGQFLDHDITMTQEHDIKCCDPGVSATDLQQHEQLRSCFNIDVQNDPFYSNHSAQTTPLMECFPFTRSGATCTDSGKREQINMLTAFIDGSNVYGSDEHRAQQLRSLNGGLLK